jgi:hypothetical protein
LPSLSSTNKPRRDGIDDSPDVQEIVKSSNSIEVSIESIDCQAALHTRYQGITHFHVGAARNELLREEVTKCVRNFCVRLMSRFQKSPSDEPLAKFIRELEI